MSRAKPKTPKQKHLIDKFAVIDGIDEHNRIVMLERIERVIQQTDKLIKSGKLNNEPLPIETLADDDLLTQYL